MSVERAVPGADEGETRAGDAARERVQVRGVLRSLSPVAGLTGRTQRGSGKAGRRGWYDGALRR